MALFQSRSVIVEANQFLHGATAPIGVFVREDGSCYVVTEQGEEVTPHLGDWIILERRGDGSRAYPCHPEIFRQKYMPYPER